MGRPTDLPPSYEETVARDPPASRPPPAFPAPPTDTAAPPIPDNRTYHSVRSDSRESDTVNLAPALSQDATALHTHIASQAEIPPRPYLTVRGSHTETRHDHNRKEDRKETVEDFTFKVDLSGYLIRDEHPPQQYNDDYDTGLQLAPDSQDGWHVLTLVRDNDGQQAYRGGRCKSDTWTGHERRARSEPVQLEDGPNHETAGLVREHEDGPSLMGWCERYCDDPAPVKSFAFGRSVVGFDSSVLHSALTSHLRSLHYKGDISITTNLANRELVVYSPHWVNQLRNNGFVYWCCIILQLWIITWPVIWFLERRYDVVRSVWYFSRVEGGETQYACYRSEAAIADELAPAVTQAALERRLDGKMLTPQEMELLDRLGKERQQRGVVVMQWDRFLGWGNDS
ncbi:hypothetical protein ASPCADRAFT_56527 [Aspergillus carbonarius ITEM 5010]|uniref:Uncharacterized protein n=1 Tax=Aspergillus carbonarius (strain ITEM 5010) TaxID=602072 RepID=A0A1R3RBV3_ASPC5|nr:hypothetical protein ASPCADRAFT_56527 [Aspergillus carbonarius ITEM 5010]